MNKMHMVRIWLTEDCNALCQFCMNSKSRGNAKMSLKKFELLCSYFKDNNFDIISVMGGEPTIHPQFTEMMLVAQKYFNRVYLYTNALAASQLLTFKPREKDILVYNFNFAKTISKEKLLLELPGERILEVIVNHNTHVDELIEDVTNVSNISVNRIKVQLVLNNSDNIFKFKDIIVEKINFIYSKLKTSGINVSFECAAPLCFTFGTSLPEHSNNTICPLEAILVDGSYNVRFCNIYPDILTNLFVSPSQDTLKPFQILRNYITQESMRVKTLCLDKICKDCFYYGSACNGKCHVGQDIISREDIVTNTLIPWLQDNV